MVRVGATSLKRATGSQQSSHPSTFMTHQDASVTALLLVKHCLLKLKNENYGPVSPLFAEFGLIGEWITTALPTKFCSRATEHVTLWNYSRFYVYYSHLDEIYCIFVAIVCLVCIVQNLKSSGALKNELNSFHRWVCAAGHVLPLNILPLRESLVCSAKCPFVEAPLYPKITVNISLFPIRLFDSRAESN